MSETPEEDAWKKMVAWAKGLLEKGARGRSYMRFFDSRIWITLEMPGNIYGTG